MKRAFDWYTGLDISCFYHSFYSTFKIFKNRATFAQVDGFARFRKTLQPFCNFDTFAYARLAGNGGKSDFDADFCIGLLSSRRTNNIWTSQSHQEIIEQMMNEKSVFLILQIGHRRRNLSCIFALEIVSAFHHLSQ